MARPGRVHSQDAASVAVRVAARQGVIAWQARPRRVSIEASHLPLPR